MPSSIGSRKAAGAAVRGVSRVLVIMPRLVARGSLRESKVWRLYPLVDIGAVVEVLGYFSGNSILGRVSVLLLLFVILEHGMNMADLDDSRDMVLEIPILPLFVDQPRLCETKSDFFPTGAGRPSYIQQVLPFSFGDPRSEGDFDGVAYLLIE